jgi:hypothetical protein
MRGYSNMNPRLRALSVIIPPSNRTVVEQDAFFLPVLQLRPVVQAPWFLESELFELVDDVVDSVADSTFVTERCWLEEFAACAVEPGFAGNITTAPVGRVAAGADIFDAHLRQLGGGG